MKCLIQHAAARAHNSSRLVLSGEPDMLDSMVASTFANVAMDLLRDGVTGRLVVDALSDRGVLAAYTPRVEDGVARLQRRARPGDVLLVLGAGDVDRAVGLLRASSIV